MRVFGPKELSIHRITLGLPRPVLDMLLDAALCADCTGPGKAAFSSGPPAWPAILESLVFLKNRRIFSLTDSVLLEQHLEKPLELGPAHVPLAAQSQSQSLCRDWPAGAKARRFLWSISTCRVFGRD